MKNKGVLIIVILGVLAAALWGGYLLYQKLKTDREMALSYIPPTAPVRVQNEGIPTREVKTYTEKDLAEMRKKGITPPNVQSPTNPSAAASANEAAVQRSLKTLEEVNRINEMNRRIQEQQERMKR